MNRAANTKQVYKSSFYNKISNSISFRYLSESIIMSHYRAVDVMSLMMSHDVIKLNFHIMSLPIFLDIGICPEKLQIKFESVYFYG